MISVTTVSFIMHTSFMSTAKELLMLLEKNVYVSLFKLLQAIMNDILMVDSLLTMGNQVISTRFRYVLSGFITQ